MKLQPFDFWASPKTFTGEKKAFLTHGAGKTGYPPVED
jgi:hypothetical protein